MTYRQLLFAFMAIYATGCGPKDTIAEMLDSKGPTRESYYDEHRLALDRFVQLHLDRLPEGHVILPVKSTDGLGDPYVFAYRDRIHFIIYRGGVPAGKTEELIYRSKSEKVADVLSEYLNLGQKVFFQRELDDKWLYFGYSD